MGGESERKPTGAEGCPLCALWAAYKDSEVAAHVRGIQREGLLLIKSLLDAGINAAETRLVRSRPKSEGGD